jgi:transcriptional regulator with XRE-family HTH domain
MYTNRILLSTKKIHSGDLVAKFLELLSKNLLRIRKERGWSQSELAAKAGLTRGAIAKYENQTGGISSVVVSRLAEALEVEESELTSDPAVKHRLEFFGTWARDLAKTHPAFSSLGGEHSVLSEEAKDTLRDAFRLMAVNVIREKQPPEPEIVHSIRRLLGAASPKQLEDVKEFLELLGLANTVEASKDEAKSLPSKLRHKARNERK